MQRNLNLDDYIRQTRDRMVYVRLRAPNFPPEDQTSTRGQFAELRHGIEEILRRTRKSDRRQWLELVLQDLERALAAYESGDRDKGLDILYSAEEHYKNAIHGKKYESPSGANGAMNAAATDSASDAGGPEEAIFAQEVQYEAQQQLESEARFRQWLKEHPESPWHRVLPPEPELKRPPTFLGRWLGRLTGEKAKEGQLTAMSE